MKIPQGLIADLVIDNLGQLAALAAEDNIVFVRNTGWLVGIVSDEAIDNVLTYASKEPFCRWKRVAGPSGSAALEVNIYNGATSYAPGTLVRFNGNFYLTERQTTAGADPESDLHIDQVVANRAEVDPGLRAHGNDEYIPLDERGVVEYKAEHTYRKGQQVTLNGTIYNVLVKHWVHSTEVKFDMMRLSPVYLKARQFYDYDADMAYKVGDVVIFIERIYRAVEDMIAATAPGGQPFINQPWYELGDRNAIPLWDSLPLVEAGGIRRHGQTIVKAKATPANSADLGRGGDAALFDPEKWDFVEQIRETELVTGRGVNAGEEFTYGGGYWRANFNFVMQAATRITSPPGGETLARATGIAAGESTYLHAGGMAYVSGQLFQLGEIVWQAKSDFYLPATSPNNHPDLSNVNFQYFSQRVGQSGLVNAATFAFVETASLVDSDVYLNPYQYAGTYGTVYRTQVKDAYGEQTLVSDIESATLRILDEDYFTGTYVGGYVDGTSDKVAPDYVEKTKGENWPSSEDHRIRTIGLSLIPGDAISSLVLQAGIVYHVRDAVVTWTGTKVGLQKLF